MYLKHINPSLNMSVSISTFFPLFDMLYEQIKNEPDSQLTDDEIKALNLKIYSLDKMGRDMIYVWIRIDSIRNTDSKLLDIPYGGVKIDNQLSGQDLVNIKFDLRQLPPRLNRMLDRFCNLHLSRMNEESQRASIDQSGGTAIKLLTNNFNENK